MDALIVGAGIAGTTLAGELQRQGVQVHVVELEPEPTFRGIGVELLPPAVRCMHMLGLIDECIDCGFPHYITSTWTADGEPVATTRLQGLLGSEYPPSLGISRPVFGEILRRPAIETGARFEFGNTVKALKNGDAEVEIEFADGDSGVYDVVIGADGLRSAIRSTVFPEEPAPSYIGQCGWRVRLGYRPEEMDGVSLFLGQSTRVIVNPILYDDMYLSLLHPTDDPRARLTADESYGLLMSLLGEYGGLVKDASRVLTPESPSHYGPLYTTFRHGPWHRGRVILIGDAAHATPPHLGVGAGIAIEDAIVLARCVREETELTKAFDKFMDRRYERCRMVIENSRTLSRWDLEAQASGAQVATLSSETWETLARPI